MNLTIFFCSLFSSCCLAQSDEFVIRSTNKGDVRGYTVPFYNESVNMNLDVFVGIPYARPPVGGMRFLHPEEPDAWDDVYDATSFSPCCPQVMDYIRDLSFGPEYDNSDEDCLYLNVYAPRNVDNSEEKYAVMVWIHGGSYRYGSGEEYDARVLAQQGVVVVTINYRLGVLAMMSTDDDIAPGNCGLMDSIMALQWVQDNIDNFGGDKDRVTIFGNSAGGGSVSLLMFSDLTEGLFHRVIAQSGDALSPWAIYRPPFLHTPMAQELADKNGCPTEDAEDMVDCLREVDAQLLVETSVGSNGDFNAAWAPRIDGVFIREAPEALLDRGEFQQVDYMCGTVPDEYSGEYDGSGDGWSKSEKESRMLSWTRRYMDRNEPADLLFLAMIHEYDLPGDDYQQQRDLFLEMRADDSYIGPHTKHAAVHSQYIDDTYMYVFNYRSEGDQKPEWMGIPHFSECYYVFGAPLWEEDAPCPWGCRNVVWHSLQEWSEVDKQTARNVMEAWTNFAKTGNPSTADYEWPRFDAASESYAEIMMSMTTKQYYKYNRMGFVNRYRPNLFNATLC